MANHEQVSQRRINRDNDQEGGENYILLRANLLNDIEEAIESIRSEQGDNVERTSIVPNANTTFGYKGRVFLKKD